MEVLQVNSKRRIYPTAAGGAAVLPDGKLYKIKAAAQERNLDEHYVRRIVEARLIPSWKVGKYRLIRLEDLDALIARGYTPAQGMSA
jgi:excisionase family DNA binding protein